ncbi:MAG TPA: hypothetical protein VJP02_15400 [Candidatus Sulfotelmatobacter sp.]|nr:hypothetical protein [Candidatus Sulfotelmatobacter sp.]
MLSLLAHTFPHFLAQILDVVPGNHYLNAMHELGLRFRVLADDLSFFGQMDFDFQIFKRHAVAEVAIKPIRLFHDGCPAGGILLKEAHHLAELLATGRFGCLHVDELMHDLEFMRAGIFPQ